MKRALLYSLLIVVFLTITITVNAADKFTYHKRYGFCNDSTLVELKKQVEWAKTAGPDSTPNTWYKIWDSSIPADWPVVTSYFEPDDDLSKDPQNDWVNGEVAKKIRRVVEQTMSNRGEFYITNRQLSAAVKQLAKEIASANSVLSTKLDSLSDKFATFATATEFNDLKGVVAKLSISHDSLVTVVANYGRALNEHSATPYKKAHAKKK